MVECLEGPCQPAALRAQRARQCPQRQLVWSARRSERETRRNQRNGASCETQLDPRHAPPHPDCGVPGSSSKAMVQR